MISIKKAAIIGASAALLFGSAMPAFAGHWRNDDDLNITQKNWASITNNVVANSNTGNQTVGENGGHDDITLNEDHDGGRGSKGNLALGTGDAATVVEVANIANSNKATVKGCGCFDDVTIDQKNGVKVTNEVLANSNTGNQTGGGSNKALFTGNAYTGVAVTNVVNSNVVKVN